MSSTGATPGTPGRSTTCWPRPPKPPPGRDMTHPLDATDRSAAMQSIRLGGQGAQVPPLGLGCMRMSGPPATRDDTEAIATIRASLDAGVGFLDTGDHYGDGHNESLVG